jgi:hypothetical protein
MLVMGGGAFLGPCDGFNTATWSYSIADRRWSQLTFDGPTPHARVYGGAVLDSARDRVLLYGGEGSLNGGACFSDAWELPLSAGSEWARVLPDSASHDFGTLQSAIYDPVGDRVVLYDGTSLWELPFRNGPGWSRIDVTGEAPPGRYRQLAIYDSRRRRMIVLGGAHGPWGSPLGDAWALSLGHSPAWSQLPIDGRQLPAVSTAAVYDEAGDQIVLLASNFYSSSVATDSTWALPLEGPLRWRLLTSTSPGGLPRRGTAGIYDSRRGRILVFGGGMEWPDSWSGNTDLWALSLTGRGGWEEIVPAGAYRPTQRTGHTLVYDPVEDRIIMLGGYIPSYYGYAVNEDGAEFKFGSNQWVRMSGYYDSVPDWVGPSVVFDTRESRAVVFQGDLLWALHSSPGDTPEGHSDAAMTGVASAQADSPNPGLALASAWPSPFSGRFTVDFALPDANGATLELIDVAGRRIWSGEVGHLGRGPHQMPIHPSSPIRPGVYLIKLSHGQSVLTKKVVSVR